MATVRRVYAPEGFRRTGNETFPEMYEAVPGSAIPTSRALAFDAAAIEAVQVRIDVSNYGSGDITVQIVWGGRTASSGDVKWGASISAITPDTDSQDPEADAWATEATVTDTHLGTTNTREMQCVATITSGGLDSIANRDSTVLRLRRLANDGADTMSGDALLYMIEVSFSDT